MKLLMWWKRFGMMALIAGLALCLPLPVVSDHNPDHGVGGPIVARQFGTPEKDQVSGISLDDAGDLFLVGPTFGDIAAPNQGGSDIWMEHSHRRGGGPQWRRQLGTEENDNCAAATNLHGPGYTYVVSSTPGSLFGPNGGGEDLAVAQYDDDGNLVWADQLAVVLDQCHGGAQLSLDAQGGVYIPGATEGAFGGPSAGLDDAYLVHYDRNGNLLWIRQIGSPGYDYAEATAPDGSGGVYVVGYTNGDLGGPGASWDAWLARYDSDGNQLWIRQFGSPAVETGASVSAVEAGTRGVYIGGITGGSFGGPYAGEADGWVARYDADGNQLWLRQFGSSGNDTVTTVTTGPGGGVYATGWTDGDLAGQNAGGRDIHLMEYNATGAQRSARQIGTSAWEEAWTLAFDPRSRVLYLGGWTEGDLGGPNAGGQDAIVVEFGGLPRQGE